MRILVGLCSAFSAVFLCVSAASAEPGNRTIDEIRLGGSWVEPRFGSTNSPYPYNEVGINVEVLLTPFDFDLREIKADGFIREILNPRLHVGALWVPDAASTSSAYLGLTWHHELYGPLFVETSFGAAVHDGDTKASLLSPTTLRRGLGSSVLFRESIAVGYEVTESINLLFQLSHMSHAGLAGSQNAGQTDVAIKLGFKF